MYLLKGFNYSCKIKKFIAKIFFQVIFKILQELPRNELNNFLINQKLTCSFWFSDIYRSNHSNEPTEKWFLFLDLSPLLFCTRTARLSWISPIRQRLLFLELFRELLKSKFQVKLFKVLHRYWKKGGKGSASRKKH